MRIARLRWDGYRIPFTAPFRTAHGELRERVGLFLRLTTDEGRTGLGEVAPLPPFGGTLQDCLAAIEEAAPGLVDLPLAGLPLCLDDLAGHPVPPALRAGLDVAACDAIARVRGTSIAGLFVAEPRRWIPVNATVGVADAREAADAARAAVAEGCRCVKLKVGVATRLADEVARVELVREAIGPSMRLRLDANGAWDVDRAIIAIRELTRFDLELVEQPVSADDLAGLARVRRAVGVPLAADEAITGLEAARAAIAAEAADVLVVKPTAAGGITVGRAIADLAAQANVQIVVTTTIEAGVGVAAALQLAATLPTSELACGLATTCLLRADLVDGAPAVHDGAMALPPAPGIGVTLDEAELAAFASGVRGEVRA